MEENKVVLNLEDYEELVEYRTNYDILRDRITHLEDCIYKYVYDYNKSYVMSVNLNAKLGDYNYECLFKILNTLGFDSVEKIDFIINDMKTRYDKERESK